MKKSVKISMIVAAGLVVLGILLSVAAFAAVGFDFKKLSTVKYEENTYTSANPIADINIDTDMADVEFKRSDDNMCRVVCYEEEKRPHEVSFEKDRLSINIKDNREWYDHLNLTLDYPKITVYLPLNKYNALTVHSDTGSVTIPDDFSFNRIGLGTNTGRLECAASAANEITMKASTGDIIAKDLSTGEMDLKASTGNVTLDGVKVEGVITAKVTTGNIKMDDVSCRNLIADSNTGNIKLSDVKAENKFDIENHTGNVEFDDCDADTITVKTSTGNIEGSLSSPKIFIANSDTGKVNVPETTDGGICRLTTDTGNIKISVE